MKGSLEITDMNGESTGVVGTHWTEEAVPVVLDALHGIADVQSVDPTTASETGRLPELQWTGRNANNQTVTIRLWEEIPFEETLAAQIGPGLVEE